MGRQKKKSNPLQATGSYHLVDGTWLSRLIIADYGWCHRGMRQPCIVSAQLLLTGASGGWPGCYVSRAGLIAPLQVWNFISLRALLSLSHLPRLTCHHMTARPQKHHKNTFLKGFIDLIMTQCLLCGACCPTFLQTKTYELNGYWVVRMQLNSRPRSHKILKASCRELH